VTKVTLYCFNTAAIFSPYEGRVAEMKLLFTKLQEEITTVKKSATQFRVETGADSSVKEFPIIELKPESTKIEQREVNSAPIASHDSRKSPLALRTKAEHVYDVVDLRGGSKGNALNPVTYSTMGALKSQPYAESVKVDIYPSSKDYGQEKISVYRKPQEREACLELDEKRARYQITARKFIATQEMIEYHTSREKKLSFELTI
jgi:hypothetical protein